MPGIFVAARRQSRGRATSLLSRKAKDQRPPALPAYITNGGVSPALRSRLTWLGSAPWRIGGNRRTEDE
jgi:hypothetical protein